MTPEQTVLQYQHQYGELRADLLRRVLLAWQTAGGVRDQDAAAFVASVVRLIGGAQVATARLVAAYLSVVTRDVLGSAALPALNVSDINVETLRGVAATEVYNRPVVTARKALSDGRNFAEAMKVAGQRAVQIADADVQMAQREATLQVVAADERIVGYRRVLTGRSCAFCATASTRRYHRGDLMPIHNHCDCGVAPIFGTADPGHVINRQRVSDLKAAARETGDAEYWKSRRITVAEDGTVNFEPAVVRQHGEMGPVLVSPDDKFTGPADIAA